MFCFLHNNKLFFILLLLNNVIDIQKTFFKKKYKRNEGEKNYVLKASETTGSKHENKEKNTI